MTPAELIAKARDCVKSLRLLAYPGLLELMAKLADALEAADNSRDKMTAAWLLSQAEAERMRSHLTGVVNLWQTNAPAKEIALACQSARAAIDAALAPRTGTPDVWGVRYGLPTLTRGTGEEGIMWYWTPFRGTEAEARKKADELNASQSQVEARKTYRAEALAARTGTGTGTKEE